MEISPYEQILNSINEEFNLELGYISVDSSKTTVAEYESVTRELAKQQREILDLIATREEISKESLLIDSASIT